MNSTADRSDKALSPVVLGMTPSEARHAAGAFFFKVIAEPSRWEKNSDPYQVELNPVRASMVQDPSRYRWSSYWHNGLGQADSRITPPPLYLAIDRNDADRQTAYRALFRSELDEEALSDIRLALTQGQPLGQGRFGDKIYAAAGVRRTQKRPGRPAGKSNQSGDTETQAGFGF